MDEAKLAEGVAEEAAALVGRPPTATDVPATSGPFLVVFLMKNGSLIRRHCPRGDDVSEVESDSLTSLTKLTSVWSEKKGSIIPVHAALMSFINAAS